MTVRFLLRLRGAAQWPEAVATVYSFEIVSDGGYKRAPPSARITITYRDTTGSIQSGSFVADSLTSLYNWRVGDTFPIRVDPRSPADFYVEGLDSAFTNMALLNRGLLAVIAVLIAIFLWKSVGR